MTTPWSNIPIFVLDYCQWDNPETAQKYKTLNINHQYGSYQEHNKPRFNGSY